MQYTYYILNIRLSRIPLNPVWKRGLCHVAAKLDIILNQRSYKYTADGRYSDFSGLFGPRRLPIRHKKFNDTLSERKWSLKDLKIFSSISIMYEYKIG